MRRDLPAEFLEAMQQPNVSLRLLYEGEFRNGIARYWTGVGPLEWDGNTFQGFGQLMGIGNTQETTDIKANSVAVTIAGVTEASVALTLNEAQRLKPGHIWIALLDDEDEMVSEPVTIFRGRLDTFDLPDSADSAAISATYAHELQAFERPKTVRYTDQEQKRLFPGDRGCEFIAGLQDTQFPWGARS